MQKLNGNFLQACKEICARLTEIENPNKNDIKNEVKDNDSLFIEVEGKKYALYLEKQPLHDPRSILMRS